MMMMMMMMMMMTSPFRKGCDLGVWSTIRGYCAGVLSFCRLMHRKKKRKKKKRKKMVDSWSDGHLRGWKDWGFQVLIRITS